MQGPEKFRCVLVGKGGRLIKCAEILLEKSHEICRVISADPLVLRWCTDKNVPSSVSLDDTEEQALQDDFDLLLSIENFSIIPEWLRILPRKFAINFHDSPLPRYAGVNATSWAIFNRESEHAVTWHLMTDKVDAGDILKQRRFPVAEDETSMMLNAHCFNECIESFSELIDEIAAGTASPVPQDLSKRTFFGMRNRPSAACTIDWSKSAEEIEAFFRALDFGHYRNPMGLPKLYFHDQAVSVKRAHVHKAETILSPGTINSVTEESLGVATRTNLVSLSEFFSSSGETLSPPDLLEKYNLRIGDRLPALEKMQALAITGINSDFCCEEPYWVERLERLHPVEIPYKTPTELNGKKNRYGQAIFSVPEQVLGQWKDYEHPGDLLLAAFALYLSRIDGKTSFDVSFWDESLHQTLFGAELYFSAQVPLRFDLEYRDTFEEMVSKFHARRRIERARGPIARDLSLRYPSIQTDSIRRFMRRPAVAVSRKNGSYREQDRIESDLHVVIADDGFECRWIYDESVLDAATIDRMQQQFKTLLIDLATRRDKPLSQLAILPEDEKRLILHEWNAAESSFSIDQSFPHLFEAQVERTPDNMAVVFQDQGITYAELNRRANQVAHYLRREGVRPGNITAIYMERSLEMVVALIGILKAGAAYLPLDPIYPPERVAFMLEDSQAGAILTQQELAGHIVPGGAKVICIDADESNIARESEENLALDGRPDDLAYLIYTSGSTGKPKGVEVPHGALSSFLQSMVLRPGIAERDRFLAITTLSFDIAELEIFGPLIVGARVVIASRVVASDGHLLAESIDNHGITIMQATPATWSLLFYTGWSPPKDLKVLCGGEALTRGMATTLIKNGASVWNMYGPTETTVWSTIWEVEPGDAPISIGRPIANTEIYILDPNLEPVPVGIPGELHIGGAGLAKGYHNRPELTSQKFIQHPFSRESGARLYKTGDLARYHADGNIECLGRIDHQVKIRGFRIELGEIEAILREHSAVQETVVVAREDIPGDKRLVAYVIPAQQPVAPNELRTFLLEKLPDYMVPSAFMKLESFPLTPNGKVDRKMLPAPEISRPALKSEFLGPRNDVEKKVCEVWADILGFGEIGVRDTFFELGGHSLSLVRMVAQLENSFATKVPIIEAFRHPTVEALAGFLTKSNESENSLDELRTNVNKQRKALMRNRRLGSRRGVS